MKDAIRLTNKTAIALRRSAQRLRAVHFVAAIILSLLLCALGVVLMIWPGLSVTAIGIASGVMLIVLGLVKLLGYFSRDLYRLAFQFDLALGILLLVLGCVILSSPDRAMSFLCLVLGIAVMCEGLFKLQMALDARRFGLRTWWLMLIVAVLTGLVGVALTFRPVESAQTLTVLMGISLLAEGVLNLITALCAVKIVKGQQADVIEGVYEEK